MGPLEMGRRRQEVFLQTGERQKKLLIPQEWFCFFLIYCCLKKHPQNLVTYNNNIYFAHESVVWPAMLGNRESLSPLSWDGWNLLMVGSLACPANHAGWLRRPWLGLLASTPAPLPVAWASPSPFGGQVPRVSVLGGRARQSCVAFSSLACEVLQHNFNCTALIRSESSSVLIC